MPKGRLIVVEGACDGIGKTTQYRLLKEHLERDGLEVVSHHFPSYGTYQGKPVEMYLRGEYGNPKELSPYFVNSLYAVDRAITWETELKNEYHEGKMILLDRYTTSSIIYQSSVYDSFDEVKRFIDFVEDFEYHKLGIQKPNQVLFLYAPFEITENLRRERIGNEGVLHDIHEEDLNYLKRVYDNALKIAEYLDWDRIDCSKENGLDNIENIHEKVYQKVRRNIQ